MIESFNAGERAGLSAAGAARKAEILNVVRRASASRRRRRRAAVTAAGAVPILLVAGVTWSLVSGGNPSRPVPAVDGAQVAQASEDPRVRVVATDPSVIGRYAVETRSTKDFLVNDDELLGLLEEAGHPAGMIRTRGKVIVTGLPTPLEAGEPAGPTGLLDRSGPEQTEG